MLNIVKRAHICFNGCNGANGGTRRADGEPRPASPRKCSGGSSVLFLLFQVTQNQKTRPIKTPERRNQRRTMIITEVMSRWVLPGRPPPIYHLSPLTWLKMLIFAPSSRLSPELQTIVYASFAGSISDSFRAFAVE